MELWRVSVIALLMTLAVLYCTAETSSCGKNEHSNPTGSCKVTCNACRDCGPCVCKSGYIRLSPKGECITEADCHNLHFTWMHDAKHSNKKDKFFNCSL